MGNTVVRLAVGFGNPAASPPILAVDNGDGTYSLAVTTHDSSDSVVLTGRERTPAASVVTSSGSVTAGKKSVSFTASSDFSGTLLGVAFAASATISFSAPPGDTLGAFAYTRSAGSLTIYTIT